MTFEDKVLKIELDSFVGVLSAQSTSAIFGDLKEVGDGYLVLSHFNGAESILATTDIVQITISTPKIRQEELDDAKWAEDHETSMVQAIREIPIGTVLQYGNSAEATTLVEKHNNFLVLEGVDGSRHWVEIGEVPIVFPSKETWELIKTQYATAKKSFVLDNAEMENLSQIRSRGRRSGES